MINRSYLKELFIALTVVVLATHFYMVQTSHMIFDMNTLYGVYVMMLVVYAYFLYDIRQQRQQQSFAMASYSPNASAEYMFNTPPPSMPTVSVNQTNEEMILTQKSCVHWMQSNAMPFAIAIYVQIDNHSELQRSYGHRFTNLMITHYNKQGYELMHKNSVFGRVSDNMFLFVFLTSTMDQDTKTHCVQKVKHLFSAPMHYENRTVRIKKTIGYAAINRSIDDDYILLNEAKLALETAYNNHLKEAEFNIKMKSKIMYETKLMNRLNQAIQEDKIQLVYQNITDMRSNEVHAIETLSRWFDVELGHIDPEKMLDIAREANLIHELDEYLIEKAMVLYNQLKKQYPTAILSLNITPETFLNPLSSKTLKTTIQRHHITAEEVCVEVPETLFAEDVKQCLDAVKAYHDEGFLIAVDDFGKSFSSLGILNKIPYDYLKIDRGLTEDIGDLKTLEIIKMLKTVTDMSGKTLIVEGVETIDQYGVLMNHDCTIMQGYYIHKPTLHEPKK